MLSSELVIIFVRFLTLRFSPLKATASSALFMPHGVTHTSESKDISRIFQLFVQQMPPGPLCVPGVLPHSEDTVEKMRVACVLTGRPVQGTQELTLNTRSDHVVCDHQFEHKCEPCS